MCEVDLLAANPVVFMHLYDSTRMLESLSKGEPIRNRDGDSGNNFARLSKFLSHTLVYPFEEITMLRGEKESFSLALASLVKMGLADDTDESKYLRDKPHTILRDFLVKLNTVRMAYANGSLDQRRGELTELHTFFNHVIMIDHQIAESKKPRGCFG